MTTLSVESSAQQIEDAVKSTFPTVVGCDVVSADNIPGRLLNRAYPRQWAVRMTRMGVVGLGVERCLNPLYIDWDPTACPGTAPDLFLNHYKWYWPSGLPKPADLSEPAALEILHRTCDAEVSSGIPMAGSEIALTICCELWKNMFVNSEKKVLCYGVT